jgi:hypothetical protein
MDLQQIAEMLSQMKADSRAWQEKIEARTKATLAETEAIKAETEAIRARTRALNEI